MSLANEASLLLIPSGYKSGIVYSVFPTDGDGDFTFTRGSDGTRKGAGGLIETMSSNIPRLDYLNSDCPSLLLEPLRTNIVYPNTSLSGYSILNGVKSDNVTISPDGENNGSLVQSNGSGTCVIYRSFGTSTNTIYNISVFLKKGNYNNIRLQEGFTNSRMVVNLSNGTEVSSNNATNKKIEDYGNGWYRVSFNYTSHSSTSSAQYSVYIDGSTASGNTFYTFGGQIEQGSYSTSYIKTTSGTVTRQKDFIDGAGSSSLFNSLESTFFVKMASFLNAQTNSNGIELADISGQNRITLQYDTINNQIRCDVRVLNSAQAIITTQSFDITNFNKMAITYKLNEVKFYVNGQLISTGTNVNLFAPNTLTEVRSTIAGISGDAYNLQAKIKDLRVYNRALTQSEAIELTTL
tara:strand:- start:4609 stop:5829 length:1221 start_codon:yes stop_codon:yes gene_type:complete